MKKVISILFFITYINWPMLSCGCHGPINDLRTDIDSSYAIFIGIITEINKKHIFHMNDGIGTGLKFINFNVLKIHKGVNHAQLKVTLFDSFSNSSCEGIFFGKEVGDTVLVFANDFKDHMLGSYICGRHPTFSELSSEESNFIDTAFWIDPRAKYQQADAFLQRKFPALHNQSIVDKRNTNQHILRVIIYISVGINFLLGILLLALKQKYQKINTS